MRPKAHTKKHPAKVVTSINFPTWKRIKKHPQPRRNCQRKITWLNPPYNKNVETKSEAKVLPFSHRPALS